MVNKILYAKPAVSDIKKLDDIVKKRLNKKLELFSQDPMTHATKLVNSPVGSYRWRIGNYRIIFDIDGKNIVILRVRHRRESYR